MRAEAKIATLSAVWRVSVGSAARVGSAAMGVVVGTGSGGRPLGAVVIGRGGLGVRRRLRWPPALPARFAETAVLLAVRKLGRGYARLLGCCWILDGLARVGVPASSGSVPADSVRSPAPDVDARFRGTGGGVVGRGAGLTTSPRGRRGDPVSGGDRGADAECDGQAARPGRYSR